LFRRHDITIHRHARLDLSPSDDDERRLSREIGDGRYQRRRHGKAMENQSKARYIFLKGALKENHQRAVTPKARS